MKHRQHKKLCKKAAQIIGGNKCFFEDGLHQVSWEVRGMDFVEWDPEPAWDWLVSRFDGAVNTMIDRNSDCGISWKPKNQMIAATPKNVFSWASAEFGVTSLSVLAVSSGSTK